ISLELPCLRNLCLSKLEPNGSWRSVRNIWDLKIGTQTIDLGGVHRESRWVCRASDWNRTYAYHSGRVRHEVEVHNLSFDGGQDTRDPYGYYCRMRCGLT
ncbi:hypothetical protein P5673_027023, partial [Acropora cervicornis]